MVFKDEAKKREEIARNAIKKAYGTEDGECSVTLFVEHHLEELNVAYWEKLLGSTNPQPENVLDSLELQPFWDEDIEELNSLDFTLPEEVTDYLICVRFSDQGIVEDIVMES